MDEDLVPLDDDEEELIPLGGDDEDMEELVPLDAPLAAADDEEELVPLDDDDEEELTPLGEADDEPRIIETEFHEADGPEEPAVLSAEEISKIEIQEPEVSEVELKTPKSEIVIPALPVSDAEFADSTAADSPAPVAAPAVEIEPLDPVSEEDAQRHVAEAVGVAESMTDAGPLAHHVSEKAAAATAALEDGNMDEGSLAGREVLALAGLYTQLSEIDRQRTQHVAQAVARSGEEQNAAVAEAIEKGLAALLRGDDFAARVKELAGEVSAEAASQAEQERGKLSERLDKLDSLGADLEIVRGEVNTARDAIKGDLDTIKSEVAADLEKLKADVAAIQADLEANTAADNTLKNEAMAEIEKIEDMAHSNKSFVNEEVQRLGREIKGLQSRNTKKFADVQADIERVRSYAEGEVTRVDETVEDASRAVSEAVGSLSEDSVRRIVK
jgi:hypothetical protein